MDEEVFESLVEAIMGLQAQLSALQAIVVERNIATVDEIVQRVEATLPVVRKRFEEMMK